MAAVVSDQSDTKLNDDDDGDEKKYPTQTDITMSDANMDSILEEIEKQPLISEKYPLQSLAHEFKDHYNFSRQLNALIAQNTYSHYRQMRRDGNCFYRAFFTRSVRNH
jgi:hypothetical protein